MTKKIPISRAKAIAKAHGLRQIVILGFDGEKTFITTYGVTADDCRQAAIAQDWWDGKVFPKAGQSNDDDQPDA